MNRTAWALALSVACGCIDGHQAIASTDKSFGSAGFYELDGKTASGGRRSDYTAAHRSLPFGTKVRVTNMGNNKSVVVVINDRGPFSGRRLIDVSKGAADRLGFTRRGLAKVKVEVVQ